jgi:hypothetical protein
MSKKNNQSVSSKEAKQPKVDEIESTFTRSEYLTLAQLAC